MTNALIQVLWCRRKNSYSLFRCLITCAAVAGFVHVIFYAYTHSSNLSSWLANADEALNSNETFQHRDIADSPEHVSNVLIKETPSEVSKLSQTPYSQDAFQTFNLSKVSSRPTDFLITLGNVTCFREGVDENAMTVNGTCSCKNGWYGSACSIPSVVYASKTPFEKNSLVLRNRPRKIIQAFPFNMEFEMLELRFLELKDVVDVYLILESNYSESGAAKDLHVLNRLKAGMYPEIANKIVHVFLDYFPEGADKNGWIAVGLHQNYIGSHGLPKISGWEMDDLFVITDADELPCREALQFLKWHDGYSEPVGFILSWTAYGFFWRSDDGRGQEGYFAITMKLLHYVIQHEVYYIRSGFEFIRKQELELKLFLKMNGSIGPWIIGTRNVKSGWHCSWCMGPNRIRNKLLSAQNGDFPRWGDYPEKSNLTYIKSLVGKGMWFDDVSMMNAVPRMFVPSGVKLNKNKYLHLIVNLYKSNGSNGVLPSVVAPPDVVSAHRHSSNSTS